VHSRGHAGQVRPFRIVVHRARFELQHGVSSSHSASLVPPHLHPSVEHRLRLFLISGHGKQQRARGARVIGRKEGAKTAAIQVETKLWKGQTRLLPVRCVTRALLPAEQESLRRSDCVCLVASSELRELRVCQRMAGVNGEHYCRHQQQQQQRGGGGTAVCVVVLSVVSVCVRCVFVLTCVLFVTCVRETE